jgi:ABC-type phosphate transport system substrate-binding protein
MARTLLCILALTTLAPVVAAGQVAVIANPSVPIETIDERGLLDLYTGEVKMWSNGGTVVLVDLKPKNEVKESFYGYLGMRPSRMKSIWLKNMLAGAGDPPKAFDSEEELLQHVASTPGAIGYVSLSRARAASGVVTLVEIPVKDK